MNNEESIREIKSVMIDNLKSDKNENIKEDIKEKVKEEEVKEEIEKEVDNVKFDNEEDAQPYNGIKNESIKRHMKNLSRLKTLYYDKEVALYSRIFQEQIREDETLSEFDKNSLLEVFQSYVNSKVDSGVTAMEQMKAIEMFALYRRNFKPIDFKFLGDVKIGNILKSRKMAVDFVTTLSNQRIAQIFLEFWIHEGAVTAKDGQSAMVVLPHLTNAMRKLIDVGILNENALAKVADVGRRKLMEINKRYGIDSEE